MMSLCFPYYFTNFSDKECINKIQELNNSCINQFSDSQTDKLKKNKDFQLLTEILFRSSNSQLLSQAPYSLITCAIKILLKYSNALFIKNKVSEKKRKFRYHIAKDNYNKLLKIYGKENSEEIIKIVIDIIHNEKLWQARGVCVEAIRSLFELEFSGSLICHEICNKIEFPEISRKADIKLIVKVLYELLDIYNWPETDETTNFLERLLTLYYKSLNDLSEDLETIFFINLRGSLELCVRHFIRNISNSHRLIVIQYMSSWSVNKNINDNVILNYGSTLEYAAYMHRTESLANTLTSDIFSLLMQMIGSTVRFVSLLGNRVLQYLIDRDRNRMLFNTPKIFFEGMQLNLNIKMCQKEDRKFFKYHREIIHDSLKKSIINHRYTRLNLETTYCTICLLAIEIPCGFSAAALSCLMMHLQEIIRKQQNKFGREASYHIHAIIVSVLSFVCWIHEAKDFHAYVNKIVMERAQWAPHLNPPLQSHYNFAEHYVLWDKPELFLVDWEVRFGLWKRFRLNQNVNNKLKKVNDKNS